MATPYDVQAYLLDRANIQDTVTRTVRTWLVLHSGC